MHNYEQKDRLRQTDDKHYGGEHGEICLDRSDEASRRSVELFLMAQLFDRSNR